MKSSCRRFSAAPAQESGHEADVQVFLETASVPLRKRGGEAKGCGWKRFYTALQTTTPHPIRTPAVIFQPPAHTQQINVPGPNFVPFSVFLGSRGHGLF
jgi:hypothetical protein